MATRLYTHLWEVQRIFFGLRIGFRISRSWCRAGMCHEDVFVTDYPRHASCRKRPTHHATDDGHDSRDRSTDETRALASLPSSQRIPQSLRIRERARLHRGLLLWWRRVRTTSFRRLVDGICIVHAPTPLNPSSTILEKMKGWKDTRRIQAS